MTEEWRVVPSYPSYEVSNAGHVRRIGAYRSTKVGRWLQPRPMKSGHVHVRLSQDGKITDTGVHRIMCEAFHGPAPSPKHLAAHRNGKPADNRPDNVRWATYQQNMDDRYEHGDITYGERNGFAKLTNEDVGLIRSHLAFGERAPVVARLWQISAEHVSRIGSRKAWPHLEF